jgi:hypothetical protein
VTFVREPLVKDCKVEGPITCSTEYQSECETIQHEHQVGHKVLTYIEYRAVSGVFRNIDPHPLSTQRVCPPPTPKVHTRRAVRGWGVNISEDARHWISLLQYNPSTTPR